MSLSIISVESNQVRIRTLTESSIGLDFPFVGSDGFSVVCFESKRIGLRVLHKVSSRA
jgi:hypothetical protein